jgi:hypothetical protein
MSISKLVRLICISAAFIPAIASAADPAGPIHQYTFKDGAAKDSAGHIDGVLHGQAKVADGKLVLENGDKTSGDKALSYLDFAQPILPKQGSVSIVVWVTCKDVGQFSRIFDFGNNDGDPPVGNAFLYLVAHHDVGAKAGITSSDTGSKSQVDGEPLDDGHPHMATVVVDGVAKKLHLYIDGKESADADDLNANTLDAVNPVHNYIGRSLSDVDPGFSGSIGEIEVYDRAQPAAEIAAQYQMEKAKFPATMPTTIPAAAGK